MSPQLSFFGDLSMPDDEKHQKFHDLVKGARVAMLTTVTSTGEMVSRPMATTDNDYSGHLWFFAWRDSMKVREIEANPNVNLSYTQGAFVSVAGKAEILHDPELNKKLWNEYAEAWFRVEPDDPGVVLIKVTATHGEYWEDPGMFANVLDAIKTRFTGDRPRRHDHDKLEPEIGHA